MFQFVVPSRQAVRRVASIALVNLALFGLVGVSEAADGSWPATVSARYKLSFNGFEVGSYRFQSTSNGKTYATMGSAEVSALFGAFKWKGGIQSSGTLDAAAPHPAGYEMNFKSKSKIGSVKLGFDAAGVKTVALVPNKPRPDAVPLKPEHFKNVLDPMSAILAMTHASGPSPCDKTVPVFDGKVRFNLVFSYKGEEKIKEDKPSGQPTKLTVCRVKYVPLAGYKPKDFINPWVDYNALEIALRPVPAANTYVPYRVTIPTSIGSAVMSAESVNITAPNKTEIALKQ